MTVAVAANRIIRCFVIVASTIRQGRAARIAQIRILRLCFITSSLLHRLVKKPRSAGSRAAPLRHRFRFASPMIRHRPLIGRTRLVLRLAETLRLASTSSSFFHLHLAGLMNPKFGCRVKGKARAGCYNCTTQTLCIRFVSPVLLCLVETMPSAGRCAALLLFVSFRLASFPGLVLSVSEVCGRDDTRSVEDQTGCAKHRIASHRIDDSFQSSESWGRSRPGGNTGFGPKCLTHCITNGICNAMC